MTRFAIALVASVLCYAMPAAATEYDDGKMIPRGDNVVDAERKGVTLGSMLERLKPGGKPTVVDVEYSLSWIDAQPAPTGGEDLKCLAEALYFEARGETVAGQFAVAEVIVNRSKSSIFPDTICGVISQGTGRKYQCQSTKGTKFICQFTHQLIPRDFIDRCVDIFHASNARWHRRWKRCHVFW